MPEPNNVEAAAVVIKITTLRRAAGDLIRSPVPEDEAVDVVGEVAAIIRDLQAFTRSLKSEMAPEATGRGYVATTSRSAKRSYNTQGLLAATVDAMDMRRPSGSPPVSLLDAMKALMDADAVRLNWRWTELQAAAVEYDIPMTIVRHEIEDGDPKALVGEVWTEATSVGAKHANGT
jgi:hypothetical protein